MGARTRGVLSSDVSKTIEKPLFDQRPALAPAPAPAPAPVPAADVFAVYGEPLSRGEVPGAELALNLIGAADGFCLRPHTLVANTR